LCRKDGGFWWKKAAEGVYIGILALFRVRCAAKGIGGKSEYKANNLLHHIDLAKSE
jgi:hypothetical protein